MDDPTPLISFLINPESPRSSRFVDSLKANRSRVQIIEPSSDDEWAPTMNAALDAAKGEFVSIVSADDRLRPDAINVLADWLTSGVDILYSDLIENDGIVRKPDYSPERLRSQYYFGGFVVYRRSLVKKLRGFRANLPGAARYDLALRASEIAREVAHVPQPLLAIGAVKEAPERREDSELHSLRRAVQRHLDRTGGGEILSISPGFADTRRIVEGSPLISIIIPTRGDVAVIHDQERSLVLEAVRSVITLSTYANLEFVVVFDPETPTQLLDDLRGLVREDRLRLVAWEQPFSFSGKMNLGVVHARGEYVLFLNDDTELVTPEWIESMLALAQRPRAGIVGAFLFFEDDTIQHAGHAYYHYGVTHVGLNSPRGANGPGDAFLVEREVDGVTAACALMRRDIYFEVGGFSPLLPGNFNDVDLCMKLASKGYVAYVTPHAQLYHFESKTRDPKVAASEVETAWGRWEHLFDRSAFSPDHPGALHEVEPVEPDWRS